jgi:hypothetical protein
MQEMHFLARLLLDIFQSLDEFHLALSPPRVNQEEYYTYLIIDDPIPDRLLVIWVERQRLDSVLLHSFLLLRVTHECIDLAVSWQCDGSAIDVSEQ